MYSPFLGMNPYTRTGFLLLSSNFLFFNQVISIKHIEKLYHLFKSIIIIVIHLL
jgi:hypothetical protein